MPQSFGTEREYLDSIAKLTQTANTFSERLKALGITPLSVTGKGKLGELSGLVSVAEIGLVANIEPSVHNLNKEVTTLAGKFSVIKDAAKKDPSLKNFFGSYTKNPVDSYKKVLSFTDTALQQVDAVVTAYAVVDRKKKPAATWIQTMLAENPSAKAAAKAQRSKLILAQVDAIVQSIRAVAHESKISLLDVRAMVGRHATPEVGQDLFVRATPDERGANTVISRF